MLPSKKRQTYRLSHTSSGVVILDEEEGRSQGGYNLRRPIHDGVVSPKVTYKYCLDRSSENCLVKSETVFVNHLYL